VPAEVPVEVLVRIFYPELSRLVGSNEVRVEGGTVGECLADLIARWPSAGPLLFDRSGVLQKQVYVFVNQEGMQKADFARPVQEKDVLLLAVLALGG
jgi:molybdopterin converting factor small subunit